MQANDFDSIARINPAVIVQIRQLESIRPGLARQLVEGFERNARQFLESVAGHIARNNVEPLRIGFHSMKGTAANLGALRLSHIAAAAEVLAREQPDQAALAGIARQLEAEFEAVRPELVRSAQIDAV